MPIEKRYSTNLIVGICDYRYTCTIAPFSFDLYIRVNSHGAVRMYVSNQVLNRVKIHELGRLKIQFNSTHFTHCLHFPVTELHSL